MTYLRALLIVLSLFGSAMAQELWLYQQTNLLVDKNITETEALWRRAAAAGYSHVMLTDSKFARLAEMPPKYHTNVGRLNKLAAELKLQIVPVAFSVGWSNDLLSTDVNQAEGQPVKDALFVVKNGDARPVADPPVTLAKPAWKDPTVAIEGNVATASPGEHARFVYNLAVAPHRVYHVSVWIRTKDFTGEPKIQALAGKPARPLHYNELGVKRTQDWTQHHIVFNSQDHEQVNLYFGQWGKATGELQWRDWQIEEAGLVNVLRRPGTPVEVKGYVEGKDYERIIDPKLGQNGYSGMYDVWHEPPPIKTKLPDGTQLRVSWYHPAVIYGGSVCICLSEMVSRGLLIQHAHAVENLFHPSAVMMGHDEIRIANTCQTCQARKLTSGQLLADNIRFCADRLKGKQLYAWNDMFDPHHNAVKDCYLVNGDLAGSWEGLDKSVTIVNWNFGKRDQSLKFFADRGHQQLIAGYYDGQVEKTRQWMESAAKVQGVVGYMYTTWENKYGDLDAFAKIVKP